MTHHLGRARGSSRSWRRWSWWVAGAALAVVGNPALWWNQSEKLAGLRGPDATGTVLVVLVALPLGVGRRRPVALGVSASALFAYDALGYPASPVDLAPLILLCWVIVESPAAVGAAATTVMAGAATAAGLLRPGSHSLLALAGDVVVVPLAAFLGVVLRARQDRQQALEAQRELRVQSSLQAAEQLLLEQRLRLARELHDSVGHGITLMALQAAAAASLLRRDPERAGELLAQVEHTSQSAVDELHQMLGVLRDPGQAPSLSEGDLETLCHRFSVPGLEVGLEVEGTARDFPEDLVEVIPAVVAEGLANVCRHAKAARATVRLRSSDDGLVLEVADDGNGPAPQGSFGLGLTGASERVRAVGGTLTLQPGASQGSVLVAAFPTARASGQ